MVLYLKFKAIMYLLLKEPFDIYKNIPLSPKGEKIHLHYSIGINLAVHVKAIYRRVYIARFLTTRIPYDFRRYPDWQLLGFHRQKICKGNKKQFYLDY